MATRYVDARNGLDVSCDPARPRQHPIWILACGQCDFLMSAVSLTALMEHEVDHLKATHGQDSEPHL